MTRFTIEGKSNVTLQNRLLALSPDGRTLVMWQTRFPLGDAPLALG